MCSIKINLNDYNGAYCPNETVSGLVECTFHTQTSFHAIRIKFKGEATTEWDDDVYQWDTKEVTREVYSGTDSYFNVAAYLVPEGEVATTVPAGTYTYPFSFTLPEEIPSSYDETSGRIYYNIKVIVDRGYQKNYAHIRAINIVPPLDLNNFPDLRVPVAFSIDENLPTRCCCTNAGMVTFKMSLPATGFVAGEEINIGCYVRNLSTVNVECVEFTVTEEVEFFAHRPSTKTKRTSNPILKYKESGIGAHGEKSWTSKLTIPMSKYYNLRVCKIMDLHYCLRAEVVMLHSREGLTTVVPIMLGTVGLTGVTTTFSGSPPPESPPPLPTSSSEDAPFLSNASGDPGPTSSAVSEAELAET